MTFLFQIIYKVISTTVRSSPYSQEMQDLIKITNLRIVFTELHTLGTLFCLTFLLPQVIVYRFFCESMDTDTSELQDIKYKHSMDWFN